jgi:hypothetical protein
MQTTKTLLLAGLAVISLGAGVANAQNLVPSFVQGQYYALPNHPVTNARMPNSQPQPALPPSGASDEAQPHSWLDSGWAGDNNPYRFQYGNLGGGGNG